MHLLQRFMGHCLEDYWDKFTIPYLDDLLIFSKTFEEYLIHIKLVLQRLKKHGIKTKPLKYKFFNISFTLEGLFLEKGAL